MFKMPPSGVVFGRHILCDRCKGIDRRRKPYSRGWVYVGDTQLMSTDVVLAKEPMRGGILYRIQCRVCLGKGYVERNIVAVKAG